MFALIKDGAVDQFPYTEKQFREANPLTQFAKPMKLPLGGKNDGHKDEQNARSRSEGLGFRDRI